jgi:hypothetical protein
MRLGMLATCGWVMAHATPAWASPAVEGTRNLSLGSVSRSSAFGTQAALLNPSNMPFTQMFAIEPMYQIQIQSRTHGLGIVIMDSLNNARIQAALGYLFMRGKPRVAFIDSMTGEQREFGLSRFGHEAFIALSVAVVKQWLAVGLKPKYQYTSLRYRDVEGVARNAHGKLNAFGLDTSMTANFAGWVGASVTVNNVTGHHAPAFTDDRSIELENVDAVPNTVENETVPELSDYPLSVGHGLSVFPLHRPEFNLNFDGTYDFTTYKFEDHVRLTYGGSAEYVVGPVPLRFGTVWDGRGRGSEDDRVFVSGGVGFLRPAKVGGVGVDAAIGFSQQVSGPDKATVLGINLGLRIHPDL